MTLTDTQLQSLAETIKQKIRNDFEEIHLSGNLMNNIVITKTDLGFQIDIPAEIYDLAIYKKDKAIVFTGKGSYAEEVDVSGGFSGKHKEYVERAIIESITEWLNSNKLKGKVTEL